MNFAQLKMPVQCPLGKKTLSKHVWFISVERSLLIDTVWVSQAEKLESQIETGPKMSKQAEKGLEPQI